MTNLPKTAPGLAADLALLRVVHDSLSRKSGEIRGQAALDIHDVLRRLQYSLIRLEDIAAEASTGRGAAQ